MRVGQGYDIHRFRAEERPPLRLGGVDIEGAPRLRGHSDGDALIHAIIDALLGAAGEGDIGRHFPPDDPQFEGIDSRELLTRVGRLVLSRGFKIGNIDATVIAERPRLGPHIDAMREALSITMAIDATCVNVKATTNEGLGEIGSGSAIAAHAVALLVDGAQ